MKQNKQEKRKLSTLEKDAIVNRILKVVAWVSVIIFLIAISFRIFNISINRDTKQDSKSSNTVTESSNLVTDDVVTFEDDGSTTEIRTAVDVATGNYYMIINVDGDIAVCPRYDANGKIMNKYNKGE